MDGNILGGDDLDLIHTVKAVDDTAHVNGFTQERIGGDGLAIHTGTGVLVAEADAQKFLDKIVDMTAGTVEGMETGQEYKAFPVES